MNKNLSIFLTTATLLFFSTGSMAKEKLSWVSFEYPPIFFKDHIANPGGLADSHENSLVECLNGYDQNRLRGLSLVRIFKYLEETKQPYCLSALGSFPGEVKNTLYSRPVFTIPSSGIVMRKDLIKKLVGDNKHISLKKLLENKELKGAHVKDGTYGKKVGEILKEVKGNKVERVRTDSLGLYRMLVKKRFDYTLDYPIGFKFNLEKLPKEKREELGMLLIKENSSAPNITAYAICSKAKGSKKIIEKINKCISSKSHKKKITDAIERYLPSTLAEDYVNLNQKVIGE